MYSEWTLDKKIEKEFIDIAPYWASLSSTCLLFLDYIFSKYMKTELYKRNLALNIKTHEFTTCEELYSSIGLFSVRFDIVDKPLSNNTICINKRESFYITNLELVGNSELIAYFSHLLKSHGSQKIVKLRILSYTDIKYFSDRNLNWNNLLVEGLVFEPIDSSPNNIFELIYNLDDKFDSVVNENNLNKLVSQVYKHNFKYKELSININSNLYNLFDKMLINNGKNNMSILSYSFNQLYILVDDFMLYDFIHSHNWSDSVYLSQLCKMYNIKIKRTENYTGDYFSCEELNMINEKINLYLSSVIV